MKISAQEAAQELLNRRKARRTLVDFCRYIVPEELPALHHEFICNACDDIVEGRLRRLMIFLPPGSAKSSYASVRFPAYYLGRLPKKSIITASYSSDLATAFGRKVRNLVDTREYGNVFTDVQLTEDSRAKGEWETNKGGSYFAAGVGSGITGRRGDLGLIDDPVKGRNEADSKTVQEATWEWYRSDFLTRLKPGAAQIIIQTRWSQKDLSGKILPENWKGESGDFIGFDGEMWKVICIPAQARENDLLGRKIGEWLWPEWFTEQFWKETKAAQQSTDIRSWNSLYQQMPTAEEGTYFKREWFKRYRIGEEPTRLAKYGASDYAVTEDSGDHTEHGVAGFDEQEDLYILDWWSGQTSPDVWIDEEIKLVKKYEPYVWVAEGGVIRRSVEPFLNKEMRNQRCYFTTEWLTSSANKAANARSFQALCSQGKVYIPYCVWGDELIEQLISFPSGKFDDKVDVCGLFGRLLDQTFGPQSIKQEKAPDNTDAWGRKRQEEEDWRLT